MGPSVRKLLSAAQLGSIARGRPRGRPKGVGGTEAVLERQGNKSFRTFTIARAHTLSRKDERSNHMIQFTVIEQLAVSVTTQEHVLVVTRSALDQVTSSRKGLHVEVETEARVRQVSRDDKNASAASQDDSRSKVASIMPDDTSSQITVKGHNSRVVTRVAEELVALIMNRLDLDLTGGGMPMNDTAIVATLRGDKRTKRIFEPKILKGGFKDLLKQCNVPVDMLREEGEEGGE